MIEKSTREARNARRSPVRMGGDPYATTSALQAALKGGNLASTSRSSGVEASSAVLDRLSCRPGL